MKIKKDVFKYKFRVAKMLKKGAYKKHHSELVIIFAQKLIKHYSKAKLKYYNIIYLSI